MSSFGNKFHIRLLVTTLLIFAFRAFSSEIFQIEFSSDINIVQKLIILDDLKLLHSFNYSSSSTSSTELKRTLKIESISGNELVNWLNQRIRFIVGENYRLRQNMYIQTDRPSYPYKKLFSEIVNESEIPKSDIKSVMSNIGVMVYKYSKQINKPIFLDLPGLELVNISSPRVGVVQIGESFFSRIKTTNDFNIVTIDLLNQFKRISTLFHEARHSDGKAKSLGFFHTLCPKGHDYEGYTACDLAANGPYRIGALILDTFDKSCIQCSEGQHDALKILRNENAYRVLTDTPHFDIDNSTNCYYDLFSNNVNPCTLKEMNSSTDFEEWDDTPESQL